MLQVWKINAVYGLTLRKKSLYFYLSFITIMSQYWIWLKCTKLENFFYYSGRMRKLPYNMWLIKKKFNFPEILKFCNWLILLLNIITITFLTMFDFYKLFKLHSILSHLKLIQASIKQIFLFRFMQFYAFNYNKLLYVIIWMGYYGIDNWPRYIMLCNCYNAVSLWK